MKSAVIFILSVAFIIGCSDKQLEKQHNQLQVQYDSVRTQDSMKAQFIDEYTSTVNEVHEYLDRIRRREGLHIQMAEDIEEKGSKKLEEKMISNIESIDSYIKRSKQKMEELKEKMKKYRLETASLDEMIANLNKTIEEKEAHIAKLKEQTEQLSQRLAEAEEELIERDNIIEEKKQQLNTAYYVMGTEQELKEKGIIKEEGGFLGLWKAKKLASGLSEEHFTSMDISTSHTIPLEPSAKEVKIMSPHNPQTYNLVEKENGQKELEILDPQSFWKMKYLVILYKS